MSYTSSHRKGVSRRVWQTRQYYFTMLVDAIETFPQSATAMSPREHSAAALIHAVRLVGAAIDADEPKEPPCAADSPNPPKPLPPEYTAGASSTSADSAASADA